MKKVLVLLSIGIAFTLSSCSKKLDDENQITGDTSIIVQTEDSSHNQQEELDNPQEEEQLSPLERDYLTMDEFLEEHLKSYGKGGVYLYNDGLLYDVPDCFKREDVRIYGINDEGCLPDSPYTEINIDFLRGMDSELYVMLPTEVYDSNPEVYIEARHDGKSFFYNNKLPLKLREVKNYSGIFIGYHGSFVFNNRNLYSKNGDWDVLLRSCSSDEILYEKTFSLKFSPLAYVVYSEEYEDPFVEIENTKLEVGKKYHMIYQGKGSCSDEGGTMAIFSYGYSSFKKLVYFPLFGVETKTDEDGICHFEFSIKEPGQYKIDFYDSGNDEIRRNYAFTSIQAKYEDIKHVEKKGTQWKVNSPEGLRLRDSPWGEKIGLLENGTVVIQTEETLYPFYDFLDGEHGFWIPVKIVEKDETHKDLPGDTLVCKMPGVTDGWVFSGFLMKNE